jgi:hypothetical protein
MEEGGTVRVGLIQHLSRWAARSIFALLLLCGVHVVGVSVDWVPYVGAPQMDYFPLDVGRPFWPQLIASTLPFMLMGLLVSVFCIAGIRGRFPDRFDRSEGLRVWGGWAMAVLTVRFLSEAFWRWPLDPADVSWIARYALVNAAVSAVLLTGMQWIVGCYARWSARPQARWAEAGLWFAGSAIVIVGFNFAMTLIQGVAPERLVSDTWQMVLLVGGVLVMVVGLTPRPASRTRHVGTRTPDQTDMSGLL